VHLLTHALAGWCTGNAVVDTPRERALCIGISLLSDLDGLAILGGVQAYYDYHHVVAHNALAGLLASGVAALFSPRPVRGFIVFLVLFHLHLAMDLLGSGSGWGIAYFWPFDCREYAVSFGWAIDAWQNYATLAVLVVWTLGLATRVRRTPLEHIAPRLEAALLNRNRRR
jgi:hypothetical protein